MNLLQIEPAVRQNDCLKKYCETRADRIAWVYKNGDKGQQYLSIVYLDGFSKQWLFYPDYIVKTIDGQVWLIETKGGEVAGIAKIWMLRLVINLLLSNSTLRSTNLILVL